MRCGGRDQRWEKNKKEMEKKENNKGSYAFVRTRVPTVAG